MTAVHPATRIDSPDALRAVMRADFTVSPQQWEAISAPLEPAVVIAGAGSGKTSVMAARVVYLVATGQVTPDQVLGLTFTTKAAHELMLMAERSCSITAAGQVSIVSSCPSGFFPSLPDCDPGREA